MAQELKADPRTGLEIIEVPVAHSKHFADLKGTLIHWFGVVDKFNRLWKPQKRVAIFTDQCIYLSRLDGGIIRCVQINNIIEVMVSEKTAIGFRVAAPDYDMCIAVDSVPNREAIVHIVSKVYWSLEGADLKIRKLTGDSGEPMQQNLQLTKPKDWVLKIEPLKSTKFLTNLMKEKKQKEDDDKRIVEEEFERIKTGLQAELQRYRSEEYDRMVDMLAQYAKTLEQKETEIARLKENSVSLEDPEVWRKCPNCAQLRRVLESHSNDDKQKIVRLEREIESQRHIVEHLQAAIQHRSSQGGAKGGAGMDGATDNSQVVVLKQELAEATRKNKEMQQLIVESPYLTTDVKQRAQKMSVMNRDGTSSIDRTPVSGANRDLHEAMAEKDREIRHLKSVLRDATFRQVQELESIRGQFQQYDDQIVSYLEKVFSGQVQPGAVGSTPQQMAQATAHAARNAAGGSGGHHVHTGGAASHASGGSYAGAATATSPYTPGGGGGGPASYSSAASPLRNNFVGGGGGGNLSGASPISTAASGLGGGNSVQRSQAYDYNNIGTPRGASPNFVPPNYDPQSRQVPSMQPNFGLTGTPYRGGGGGGGGGASPSAGIGSGGFGSPLGRY